MKHKHKGFVLIELIIFIVVTSLLAVTIFLTSFTVLSKSPQLYYADIAQFLATQCMEGVIGQRRLLGYYGTNLATCSTTPLVSLPVGCTTTIPGFSISVVNACGSTLGGDTASSLASNTLTVTVSGLSAATLSFLVTNY